MGQVCQCINVATLVYLFWDDIIMLKEYRLRKKLSQEDLERLTGLDRKTIFRIENDLNMPLIDTYAKLVTALELSDKEIVDEIKKILNTKHIK